MALCVCTCGFSCCITSAPRCPTAMASASIAARQVGISTDREELAADMLDQFKRQQLLYVPRAFAPDSSVEEVKMQPRAAQFAIVRQPVPDSDMMPACVARAGTEATPHVGVAFGGQLWRARRSQCRPVCLCRRYMECRAWHWGHAAIASKAPVCARLGSRHRGGADQSRQDHGEGRSGRWTLVRVMRCAALS